MSTLQRDLALHEPWQKSLDRSRRRRELAARARKEVARRKGASAAMATAMLAGPAAPFAAAAQGGSTKRGDDASAPASDAGSGQQIEIRAGGLPLSFGYEGDMVAALQKGVGVESDGIFGPITQNAVKAFQRRAGLPVTGVVDPATWQALFSGTAAQGTASSSSAPGPVVDLEASKAVERAVPAPQTTPAVNVAAAAKPRLETADEPAKPKAKHRSRSVERSEPRRERHSAPKRRTAPKRVKTKPVVDRRPDRGRALRLAPGQAGQGHADLGLRHALGPHARGRGHLGPDRHGDPCRRLWRDQLQGPAERLREHHLHQAHEPVLDVLRPHVALRRNLRSRACGPGDRLRGLHRQLHRAPPALRDPCRWPGPQPRVVPARGADLQPADRQAGLGAPRSGAQGDVPHQVHQAQLHGHQLIALERRVEPDHGLDRAGQLGLAAAGPGSGPRAADGRAAGPAGPGPSARSGAAEGDRDAADRGPGSRPGGARGR